MKGRNKERFSAENARGYVIGVDGGGTKTIAALSDLQGKIKKTSRTGPSNLRNVGLEKTAKNISRAILKITAGVRKKEILSIYIALAGVEEEFKFKKNELKKEILKNSKISKILKGKIKIISDQIAAFRGGTDEKDGVVLISGTGSVARGWKGGKEIKVSGWGWANDEGSGFWVGQKGYQAIFKDLDGRGPKTRITKLIFQEWKLKKKEDLMKKIYSSNAISTISSISKIADMAAGKGDRIAISIMKEAAKELARATNYVIQKLSFQNEKFPLVLVGSMFRSNILLNIFKKEVKKKAPRVHLIQAEQESVKGAIKLAIEQVRK
jgi:N-acetylglucosamine kinase-like BadF-type ATPase